MIDKGNSVNDIYIPGVSNVLDSTDFQSTSLLNTNSSIVSEEQSTYDRLNQMFEDQSSQQKMVLIAREILGESGSELTDDQVFELVTNVQFLVDVWEEEFEKEVFNGKTLKELLG